MAIRNAAVVQKLKLKSKTGLISALHDGVGTTIQRDGLTYAVNQDLSKFGKLATFDPSIYDVGVQNEQDGSFARIAVAELIARGIVNIGVGYTVYATRAIAAAASIPTSSTFIVSRHSVGSDFAPAFYTAGTSTGPLAFQDALSNWYQLAEVAPYKAAWFNASSSYSDNTAAVNAGIAALNVIGGGDLLFEGGVFLFTGTAASTGIIPINSHTNVRLVGKSGQNGGGGNKTTLRFNGTGTGRFISIRGTSVGCGISRMKIDYTASGFTGDLVSIGDNAGLCTQHVIEDATLAFGGTYYTACLLDLSDGSQIVSCNNVTFNGGFPSVRGYNLNTRFSTVIKFNECLFLSHKGAAVQYGGEAWKFDACTFEFDNLGAPNAFQGASVVPATGISFNDCWMGDSTAAGVWVTYFGTGLNISGGRWSGNLAYANYAVDLNNATGVSISGATFDSFTSAFSLDTGLNSGVIIGNTFVNCTNKIINLVNRGTLTCHSNIAPTELDPATGSVTIDIPSIADGAFYTTNVTATGATLGDFVQVSHSVGVGGLIVTGNVTASNTVTVNFFNKSGAAIDPASATLRVIARKP